MLNLNTKRLSVPTCIQLIPSPAQIIWVKISGTYAMRGDIKDGTWFGKSWKKNNFQKRN